jgi:dihydrofolate synthase/folylpolyglutamate synthase
VNFAEAENYLFSLGNEVETMKLGLENIRTLLAALGNPENNYRKVQIAGTNGKGSVCAFLDSICLEAGIRTGRYTSPHLISIRERVKIDGVDIIADEFAKHATRIREAAESLVSNGGLESMPTFFEQMTAIGLLAFADAKVELAILETGLGGRYDATTAANAEIAAITCIDLDHQEYLGDSIEKIAAEKAAIIRPDSHVVAVRQSREAEQAIRGRCRDVGVEPVWATTNIVTTANGEPTPPMCTYTFATDRNVYPNIDSGLLGAHQAENAAAAIALAEVLQDTGFDISQFDICIGLETATHPGRLEFDNGILFDGAHNLAGATALGDFLNDFGDRPITLVFGGMKDKAVGDILRILVPRAETVILTRPDSPRAMRASEMLKHIPAGFSTAKVMATDSVEEALMAASSRVERGLILVTGSLYLVGEAKRLLAEIRI